MTHHQFVLLLCAYVVVVGVVFASERYVPLPEHVRRAKPNLREILLQKSRIYLGLFGLTHFLVVAATVVGLIGMFSRWHFAPWIFAGSIAGKILLFPSVSWKVRSGLQNMFGEIELLLDGVILTLVFFGPARPLFFLDR